MYTIRPVQPTDYPEWLRLRTTLWPDEDPAGLALDLDEMVQDIAHQAIFVAQRPGAGLCGLIELSIRESVDWCQTRHVGYIEGWYVDPDIQSKGVGRALVEAGEAWARSMGCREMASDTNEDYPTSPRAHKGLGYADVEHKICFQKWLQLKEGKTMSEPTNSKSGSVQYVNPPGLPASPAYTQMVVASGPVKTIYIGMQNAVDAERHIVGKGDIAAQTEQALKNIQACLDAAGAKPEHIVLMNVYVQQGQSIQDGFGAFQRFWGARPNPPANSVIFVPAFTPPDFLVGIDAIAVIPL
jgi:enamine deaminase RidA (YjgF/YER057c/UK114 family)